MAQWLMNPTKNHEPAGRGRAQFHLGDQIEAPRCEPKRRRLDGERTLHQLLLGAGGPGHTHPLEAGGGHLSQEACAHGRRPIAASARNTPAAAPLSMAWAARSTPSRGPPARPAISRASAAPSSRQSRCGP